MLLLLLELGRRWVFWGFLFLVGFLGAKIAKYFLVGLVSWLRDRADLISLLNPLIRFYYFGGIAGLHA
jgi:hypothetical protein